MKLLTTCAAIGVAAVLSIATAAEEVRADYPDKPVSFVVPFPPGDLEDILTRLIAERMQEETGVAASVVNKPGGGGGPFPGAVEVANGPTDGSVIGSFVVDVVVVGPQIGIPELQPNPFEPIGIFLTYPFVLATKQDSPYASIQDLASYARDSDVSLGHFGNFLLPTQVSFALAKKLGFEWGSEAAFDALDCNTIASRDADVINTTIVSILPCMDDVRVLTSVTEARLPVTPDVATVGELVPELTVGLWNGLFVKTGTPQEVKDVIAGIAQEVIAGQQAQQVARETGALIYWKGENEAVAQIEQDIATTDLVSEVLAE